MKKVGRGYYEHKLGVITYIISGGASKEEL